MSKNVSQMVLSRLRNGYLRRILSIVCLSLFLLVAQSARGQEAHVEAQSILLVQGALTQELRDLREIVNRLARERGMRADFQKLLTEKEAALAKNWFFEIYDNADLKSAIASLNENIRNTERWIADDEKLRDAKIDELHAKIATHLRSIDANAAPLDKAAFAAIFKGEEARRFPERPYQKLYDDPITDLDRYTSATGAYLYGTFVDQIIHPLDEGGIVRNSGKMLYGVGKGACVTVRELGYIALDLGTAAWEPFGYIPDDAYHSGVARLLNEKGISAETGAMLAYGIYDSTIGNLVRCAETGDTTYVGEGMFNIAALVLPAKAIPKIPGLRVPVPAPQILVTTGGGTQAVMTYSAYSMANLPRVAGTSLMVLEQGGLEATPSTTMTPPQEVANIPGAIVIGGKQVMAPAMPIMRNDDFPINLDRDRPGDEVVEMMIVLVDEPMPQLPSPKDPWYKALQRLWQETPKRLGELVEKTSGGRLRPFWKKVAEEELHMVGVETSYWAESILRRLEEGLPVTTEELVAFNARMLPDGLDGLGKSLDFFGRELKGLYKKGAKGAKKPTRRTYLARLDELIEAPTQLNRSPSLLQGHLTRSAHDWVARHDFLKSFKAETGIDLLAQVQELLAAELKAAKRQKLPLQELRYRRLQRLCDEAQEISRTLDTIYSSPVLEVVQKMRVEAVLRILERRYPYRARINAIEGAVRPIAAAVGVVGTVSWWMLSVLEGNEINEAKAAALQQYYGVDPQQIAAVDTNTQLSEAEKQALKNKIKHDGLQTLVEGFEAFSGATGVIAVIEHLVEQAQHDRVMLLAKPADQVDPLLLAERDAWILAWEKEIEKLDSAPMGKAYVEQLALEAEELWQSHRALRQQCIAKGLIDANAPLIPESAIVFEPPLYDFEVQTGK